jgi:uncharacterized protein (TIGR02271 family)
MISQEQLREIEGATVYGNGEKVGKAGQIFLDDTTSTPEWVTVNTGLFKGRETFVPLAKADLRDGDLQVPFDKETIKGAPNVDVDNGHLNPDEEAELYRHYGLADHGSDSFTNTNRASDPNDSPSSTGERAGVDGAVTDDERDTQRDTRGLDGDDAMTRSEERLNVGTERQEAGRARLRKYVVTEQVQQTVPVEREEVRVEREPITAADREAATDGPDITDDEHEVVLHEDRPVVQKETVPVERVRLSKDTVMDEEQVSDEVRKEQIESDGDIDVNSGQREDHR